MKQEEIEERILQILEKKVRATKKTLLAEVKRRWDEKLKEHEFLQALEELIEGDALAINESRWTRKDKELYYITDWKLEDRKDESEEE